MAIIRFMILFENSTDTHYTTTLLETITKELTKKSVELLLTCNEEIASLNAHYRAKNAPTDVLSFPLETKELLGSIVISEDFVKQAAERFAHTPQEEFTLLYIHGLLHLLGYDHEKDDGQMRKKERQIIEKYALPMSLIVRVEES